MKIDLENLVDQIADRVAGRASWKDIMEDEPGLVEAEAYSVQAGLMRRRIAEGETVIGYKAAYTSAAIQAQRGNGGPIAGAILRSAHLPESAPIAIVQNSRNAVEPEVAIHPAVADAIRERSAGRR